MSTCTSSSRSNPKQNHETEVSTVLAQAPIWPPPFSLIPLQTSPDATIDIKVGGAPAIYRTTAQLRNTWEATAFQLERLQAAEECVEAEEASQAWRTAPVWKLPYKPTWTSPEKMAATNKVCVAFLKEFPPGVGINFQGCWKLLC